MIKREGTGTGNKNREKQPETGKMLKCIRKQMNGRKKIKIEKTIIAEKKYIIRNKQQEHDRAEKRQKAERGTGRQKRIHIQPQSMVYPALDVQSLSKEVLRNNFWVFS